MVDCLAVGMMRHAMYIEDGRFYAAEVVKLSHLKNRPVKAGEVCRC